MSLPAWVSQALRLEPDSGQAALFEGPGSSDLTSTSEGAERTETGCPRQGGQPGTSALPRGLLGALLHSDLSLRRCQELSLLASNVLASSLQ